MANYSAFLQYGGSYNTNGYIAQSTGSSDPTVTRYPTVSAVENVHVNGHSLRSGLTAAPMLNTSSFQVNGSGNTSPRNGVIGSDRIFTDESHSLNAHRTSSALHSSHSNSQAQAVSNFTQLTESRELYPPSEPIANRSRTPIEGGIRTDSTISDIEDGEVDDEGVDKPQNALRESGVGAVYSHHAQRIDSEPHFPTVAVDSEGGMSVERGLRLEQVQRLLPSQYEQHPNIDSRANDLCKRDSNTSNRNPLNNVAPVNTEADARGVVNEPNVTGKREAAKAALLQLQSHGFTFDQIIDQGMNPEVLRSLHAELSIPIIRTTESQQDGSISLSYLPSTETEYIAPIANIDSSLEETSVVFGKREMKGSLPALPHEPQARKEHDTRLVAPSSNSKRSADGPFRKTLGTKTSEGKPMDRKEYIARMLAAKAGKPDSVTGTSIPRTSAATVSAPDAQAPAVIAATTIKLPANETKSGPRAADQALPKDDDDAETKKRKAITDLARQKMEALKLPQEARNAISNQSPKQTVLSQVEKVAKDQAYTDIAAPQPATINRQSSYFSPISQKSPFPLPGLFMTSSVAGAAASSQPLLGGISTNDQQSQQLTTPTSPASRSKPPIKAASSEGEISLNPEDTHERVALDSTVTLHRKRQKAADFLDSPATRIKRPLAQQGNSNIIIEISEEETLDDSEDDDLDDDLDDASIASRRIASIHPQIVNPIDKRSKSIKDQPPLSDSPSRKKALGMPPTTSMESNKVREPEGLKTKEMEIELMNRKIAELEQRISAKKTISRADTPGTGAAANSSTRSGTISETQEASENPEAIERKAYESEEMSDSMAAVAYQNGTAATEQKLHAIEQAKAKVERSLAADVAEVSGERPSPDTLEPDTISRESQVMEKPVTLDESVLQQEVDFPQLQHSDHIESEPEKSHSPQGRPSDQLQRGGFSYLQEKVASVRGTGELIVQNEDWPEALNEEQRQRRAAIESGIPILDAVVNRTQRRIEALRTEIANLEMEVQRGVEGRKSLIEELSALSDHARSLSIPEHLNAGDNRLAVPPIIEESLRTQVAGTGSISPNVRSATDPPLPRSPSLEIMDTLEAANLSIQPLPQGSNSRSPASSGGLSEGELEEDNMDISRSEGDEDEDVSNEFRAPQIGSLSNTSMDNEVPYEPPIHVIRADGSKPNGAQDPAKGTPEQTPDMTNSSSLIDGQYSTEGKLPSAGQEPDADAKEPLGEATRSPLVNDASDPDDYEPPEPPPSQGRIFTSATVASTSLPAPTNNAIAERPIARYSVVPVSAIPDLIDAATDEAGLLENEPSEHHQQRRHFTPYESPLKQFRSFRNHPEYLSEVPTGFRSLTYSHAIDPAVPICRYEIDGVCNDASCEGQHFKTIGLSDERILVDLGEIPKGCDSAAYTAGLKQLVQNIRSRKIKDVNQVASEITAYRRRFLGDGKVLSL